MYAVSESEELISAKFQLLYAYGDYSGSGSGCAVEIDLKFGSKALLVQTLSKASGAFGDISGSGQVWDCLSGF